MPEDSKKLPMSIDYSIIEELKSLDDDQENGSGMTKLIEIFIKETEKGIAFLEQLLPLKEGIPLSQAAHSLKSGSAAMGIKYMADIAGEMERLSKSNNFNTLDGLFATLKLEYSKVKLELLSIKKT